MNYRIIKRGSYYCAQRKRFNLFWVDCEMTEFDPFLGACVQSTNLEAVEKYVHTKANERKCESW